MTTGDSDQRRKQLAHLHEEFHAGWNADSLPGFLERLRAEGCDAAALAGFAAADLERRWQAGDRKSIDDYCREIAELGRPGAPLAELILAEFEARRAGGDVVEIEDYLRRFPQDARQVRQLIETGSAPLPPSAEKQDDPLPESFGRYKILRRLAGGGMGDVYLAYDAQMNREIALKKPKLSSGGPDQMIKRFTREAKLAARLRHPHICQVFEFGEIEGQFYLTMTYIDGQNLDQRQADRPLEDDQIVVLMCKVARALAHAHQADVIHRDLKPSNIMIDRDGEPWVTDFGLARNTTLKQPEITGSGVVLGTPAYMAPEQLENDPSRIGPQCDMFSLGVIFYELLARKRLFSSVGRQPPPPISQVRPDVDPGLESICLQMLALEPEKRIASMQQLAEMLQAYPAARAPSRQPMRIAIAVIAALVMLLAAVWWRPLARWNHSPAAPGETSAPQPAAETPRDQLARFQQLRNRILARGPRPGEAQQAAQESSELIQLCEQCLDIYQVLQRDDWSQDPQIQQLDAAEQERLLDDVEGIISTYCKAQHGSGIRGAMFTGLGIQLRLASDDPSETLGRVMILEDRGPASVAGIRIDDKVFRIDGQDIRQLGGSRADIDAHLNGAPASQLALTVVSAGSNQVRTVPVKRDQNGGAGLSIAMVSQLVTAFVDEPTARRTGVQDGDLLVSLNGMPAEGEAKIVDGQVSTLPFIGYLKTMRWTTSQDLKLLLLSKISGQTYEATLDGDRQAAAASRRAILFYLADNMQLIRGGIEWAKSQNDPEKVKPWGLDDPNAPTEDFLRVYYVNEFGWPREVVDQVIPLTSSRHQNFQKGLIYSGGGAFELAIKEFRHEVQDHPSHADSYRMMGLCFHQLQQWDNAVDAWSSYIATGHAVAQGYLWRARANYQRHFAEQDSARAAAYLAAARADLQSTLAERAGPTIESDARDLLKTIDGSR